MWRLDEIKEAVRGTVRSLETDTFTGISTDSRTIGQGELFVPITGETFDGHLFIEAAYERSHAGSLCERKREDLCEQLPGTIILVDDTTQALLDLARFKRSKLRTTCIAITGSNGKTTTKEILVRMIQSGSSVHFNEKNYNNLIGVSKSILSVKGNPEFCVFELGTNAPGEIKRLAHAAQPDTSLITNINPSHLSGLKTIEGILEEKLDLFYFTKEGGRVFVNADDPYIMPRYKDIKRMPVTYGIDHDASVQLSIDARFGWEGSQITIAFPDKRVSAHTALLGKHNLYNILAASCLAYSIGVDTTRIGNTIEAFRSYDKRFQPVPARSGATIIDDTYNANPASVKWAIKTLLELPASGKRIIILGDMRELGEESTRYHRELGRFLRSTDIPVIALIGEEVKETYGELGKARARLFENKGALVDYITGELKEGDTVLVKGSRLSKMEEIVEALT
ncbi:MAG TPA: UDP-N-acetylmuramoyl-tripeptide--D-alanyl-D-alanine ligase [Syntrophorhabdaceae bacterium]|nr:UDP-N-acetylmuramoyl-tripeptide--D-alanyl-D-alanine ligase [Syntrophorhabdaceae bacterium]